MTHMLFILMRTDMESMNPGKAMAQASHASLLLAKDMKETRADSKIRKAYKEWLKEGKGFGTTIVLGGNIESIEKALALAKKCNMIHNMIHDSTYPISDGDIIHYISIDTCGYIFTDNEIELSQAILEEFKLHE